MDRDTPRKSRSQIERELDVLARPAPLADKGGRDQHDRTELASWWSLRKRVDKYCGPDRMPDDDRAIVQRVELLLECLFPCVVFRIILVWHPWITDLEIRPKLARQARDKLVIPLVMHSGTSTLNEEYLTTHGAPPVPEYSDKMRHRLTLVPGKRLNCFLT